MNQLKLLIFSLSIQVFSQSPNINEIRKDIYQIILNDIQNNKPNYMIKQIYLDDKIVKFKNINLLEMDIELDEPIYERDSSICSYLSKVNCVEKNIIDNYKLTKIYVTHNDLEYPDFYGIYPPLDTWTNIIYQITSNSLKQNSKLTSEIVIPVKNIYFKEGKEISKFYFYKFFIDENYKIIDNQRISF